MATSRPVVGEAIADAAWSEYTATWGAYRARRETLLRVRLAREAYDRAQAGIERAARREAIAWRQATR